MRYKVITYIEKFLGLGEVLSCLFTLDILAGLWIRSLIGDAEELGDTLDLAVALLLEQVADLLKLVNTVVGAVSDYVVHHIDQVLIEILAWAVLGILQDVSQGVKLLDLLWGIAT
jgi:hypothetical protein